MKRPLSPLRLMPFAPAGVIMLLAIGLPLHIAAAPATTEDPEPGPAERDFALRLAAEGDVRSAAVEFRRLAGQAPSAADRSGWYWAAAYHYWRIQEWAVADRLLDHAEDAGPEFDSAINWLRATLATEQQRLREANFYWSSLLDPLPPDSPAAIVAQRRLAASQLQRGELATARQTLAHAPETNEAALAALDAYAAGHDKRPALGGALGMFPGLGYAYAGEYGNAIRSFILNALFLFGMVDTARNDHWGGFAVITFFEITWFTGSIYGGIDASHRYNQRRLGDAVTAIQGDSAFVPDWEHWPQIRLQFRF